MTTAEQKELAMDFMSEFEDPDPARLATMVANDFEWKVMTRMPGMEPVKGREAFKDFVKELKAMMPNGLNLKIDTVICEQDHCAIQAESNTTTANGRKYNNRYHFYLRFEGDKIAEVREYCDTNHVREVFISP
jgi:ketosteroid isomerase-like protein